MLGAFAALSVTGGLLLLTLHFLRRMHGGGPVARAKALPLVVMQRVATGPRQGVALVRVGGRVLVVSLAEGGARMLTELEGEDLRQALAAAEPTAATAATPLAAARAPLLPLFAKLGLALLFAVGLPPGAAAQQAPAPQAGAQTRSQTQAELRLQRARELQQARRQARRPAEATAPAQAQAPAQRFETVPPKTGPVPAQAAPPSSGAAVAAPPLAPARPAIRGPHVEPPAPPKVDFRIGEGDGAVRFSGSIGLVVFLGAMTLLPAIVLLMTSFTRILIVLHFLRTAIGTQTTPPGQLLVAVAVLLTGVVMNPVLQRTNEAGLKPYFEGRLTQQEAWAAGIQPLRDFMLANTRDQDLASMAEMAGQEDVESLDDLPITTVTSAFVTSELRTAFQMGFVIFLPFIVIDLIVASSLMSLGMMMLPPAMVSLPFKLLLFVLADGWTLIVRSLVQSFKV